MNSILIDWEKIKYKQYTIVDFKKVRERQIQGKIEGKRNSLKQKDDI